MDHRRMKDERETGIERKRSDKDIVPEFERGEDALDFMERKLNGSWTDALDQTDKAQYEVLPDINLDDPNDVDAAFRKMMGL
jgi:hypothetical protein